MAKNITLLGASYSDVPGVILPQTGGGDAAFFDVSGVTAQPADVTAGKWFMTALGVLTQGTAGGGGGLEYEEGIWTPSNDVASHQILFANSHDAAPVFAGLADATGTSDTTTNTNCAMAIFDFYHCLGASVSYSSSAKRYGMATYAYRGNSTGSLSSATTLITYSDGSSSASYMGYWLSRTFFRAYSNSTSRYWRAGRQYKWIAVWAP